MVLESCWENSEILPWVLFVRKRPLHYRHKFKQRCPRRFSSVLYKKIYKIYTAKYSGKIRFSHPEQLTVLNIKINFSHKNTIWDNLRSFKDLNINRAEQLTVLNIKINFSHKNTIWDNLRSFKDLNINRVIRKPWKNFTRNFWLTFG